MNHKQMPMIQIETDFNLKPFGADGSGLSNGSLALLIGLLGIVGSGFDECVAPKLCEPALDFGGTGGGALDLGTWRLRILWLSDIASS